MLKGIGLMKKISEADKKKFAEGVKRTSKKYGFLVEKKEDKKVKGK